MGFRKMEIQGPEKKKAKFKNELYCEEVSMGIHDAGAWLQLIETNDGDGLAASCSQTMESQRQSGQATSRRWIQQRRKCSCPARRKGGRSPFTSGTPHVTSRKSSDREPITLVRQGWGNNRRHGYDGHWSSAWVKRRRRHLPALLRLCVFSHPTCRDARSFCKSRLDRSLRCHLTIYLVCWSL